jgi:DNA mismatch endonuclease, patch repair protein
MQAQARRDTGCELALRSTLYAAGYRYRIHARVLPDLRREADLVFHRARVVVFVDGCFWHGCSRHKKPVKANAAWWQAKLARTMQRDRDTNAKLVNAGWSVVRVWEHSDPLVAALAIGQILRRPGAPRLVLI